MGRPKGSKNKDSRTLLSHVLDADPEFQAKLLLKANEAFDHIYAYLDELVKGNIQEEVFVYRKGPDGQVVEIKRTKPVPHNTRVTASKVLKEMTIDKTVSDKREMTKDKDRGILKGVKDAVSAVESKIRKDKRDAARRAAIKEEKERGNRI